MTCIVGIRTADNVYLGGDRLQGCSGYYELSQTPKVFKKDNIIIGSCGSIRDANLLRYALEIPENTRTNLEEYMILDLVEAIRKLLRERGASIVNNSEETINSGFMIGIDNRLFKIGCDYQVAEKFEEYTADGSGRDLALGALSATKELDVHKRLELALQAAEKHVPTVRGPFDIVSLNNES